MSGEGQGNRRVMQKSEHALPSERPVNPKPRLQGSVLVVEDDVDIRSMTATILQVAGAIVYEASSAAEAFAKIQEEEIDAIVLDWNLTGETGSALLEKLRDRHPGLLRRSAVVTGDLMSIPGRHEAERFGCPVLAKPFRPRQLIETVAQILSLDD
jgi:CheY-like chemotaxis protein